MANLVQIDFVNPKPIKLDDQVNLKDIFNILIEKGAVSERTKYAHWIENKLRYYTENVDYYTSAKKSTRNGARGATIERVHSTTIQVAMEVVANGHKEAGHQMRRYLTECLRMTMNRPAAGKGRAELLLEAVALLAEQERRLEELREQTPRLVEQKIEEAFQDKYAFPEDCMRIGEIVSTFFPGVARDKVLNFLNNIKHPRGSHTHIDDNGLRTVSHPFKREGLQELSEAFFEEREFVKETEKSYFWYHPMAGTMRESKWV